MANVTTGHIARPLPDALFGVWHLVSFVRRIDGKKRADMLGPDPLGQISYQRDLHMSALLSARDRPWADGEAFLSAPPERQAKAAVMFSAYGGPFRIEGDLVIHHVEVALWPEHIGQDLVRRVSWLGDDLVLTTAALSTPSGRSLDDQLRWRRVQA